MKYKPLKGLVVAAMLASSLVLAAPQREFDTCNKRKPL